MNHILITGATGALGSELIPRFLRDHKARVSLLLRAESTEQLEQRRLKLLQYLMIDPHSEDGQRVQAVRGDTSQPALGMSADIFQELSHCLTHIVHSAGNVKLNQPLVEAQKTAVEGARVIVDLTECCMAAGQFRKLEFVSTVGVAGRRSGLIPEDRFSGSRDPSDFHNTYEAAKWQAEQFLWDKIDSGLPATVHRPSMIVGDSRNGQIIHFQVFYYLTDFLIGRKTWGIVPSTNGASLDIIPVDYVAEAITKSASEQLGVGQLWHLCSGPQAAWTLDKLVVEIRQLLQARGEPLPKLRTIGRGSFRLALRAMTTVSGERKRRFLRGLPFMLDYLDDRQQFDNAHTDELLRAHGLSVPNVDSYLKIIMDKFWDRQRVKG